MKPVAELISAAPAVAPQEGPPAAVQPGPGTGDDGRPGRGRRIVLVGSGAIGVTNLPALAAALVFNERAEVVVALTEAATRLVSAEALSALAGHPVLGPGWSPRSHDRAEHVRWAQWADVVLVWPATLNFCARCAYGLSSDLPSSLVLSAPGPVVFAPSLPPGTVERGVYLRVRRLLEADGHLILGPVSGPGITDRQDSDGACVSAAEAVRTIRSLTAGVLSAE